MSGRFLSVARIGGAVTCCLVLTACGNVRFGEFSAGDNAMVETQAPFNEQLSARYLAMAESEYDEGDYSDSDYFLAKSSAAAGGAEVLPQPIAERRLVDDSPAELGAARESLVALLNPRGRKRAAEPLARAQTAFDCWLQEEEERVQIREIRECRKAFNLAMADAEAALVPRDLVVILPDEDGKIGGVEVTDGDRKVLLNEPLAAAAVTAGGTDTFKAEENEVVETFEEAIAARPIAPESYTVFFSSGTSDVESGDAATLDKAVADVNRRPSPEVLVIGHADRVASYGYNDRLAKRRAEAVRGMLTDKGVPNGIITTDGRGERQPLVPTADGVNEPRNRRVEITVR
ncbi:MAG: OmpA family protein [Magnetospiraceae bacterium]